MPVDKRFRMKIVESRRVPKSERRPAPTPRLNAKPTTSQIVRAFKQARDYETIVARIPKAATVAGWDTGTQVGYFSVCNKSGNARFLDLWDCDLFDFVSDMKRSASNCYAWFSHSGYSTWGSGQTATGRINCHFDAATAGEYACVVQLRSDPLSATSKVECFIDSSSFGVLPFSGTILQSHFSVLSAGGHHFRIRQVDGAFYFLSLTVYKF